MGESTVVRPVRVGVNLLFLTPERISGTATYAWSLLARLQHRPDMKLVLFVQDGSVDPSIERELVDVVVCPTFATTNRRVVWEHTMLPWRTRKHSLDVFWSPGFVSPRFTRCPRVVTVHDLYYVHVPAALPFIRRQYYSAGIPWSVRHCDAVLSVSASTAGDLAREIPRSIDKVTVVHLAARSDLVGLDVEPTVSDQPYFLLVASVTRNKNVDTVVRAAIASRRAGRDLYVKFAGEDPYGLLEQAMRQSGAAEAVEALGEVSDAELASLYRGAVAAVMPSIYEGFGLPALEAQALDTPLISARSGSLPEVAGEGALYFDHDSPAQLQDAMASLLDDSNLRADLIERGSANVSRFSWERAADETASVLTHVGRRT